MFAIMKFCDRPDAIAFPHAFILTVKIFNQEEKQRAEQQAMGTSSAKPLCESPEVSDLEGSNSPHRHSPFRPYEEELAEEISSARPETSDNVDNADNADNSGRDRGTGTRTAKLPPVQTL
jgi:hypothetical protein